MGDDEVWRPVVGYEGSYEVSNQGRVRSMDRMVYETRRGRLVVVNRRGQLLAPWPNKRTGHLRVRLSGRIEHSVHHLVLEAFVRPRPPGLIGLHTNDVPDDNRVENLRWGTYGDNGRDAVRNGVHPMSVRARCPRGHLLAIPNLRLSGLRRGDRDCLACNRAACARRRHGQTPEWLQIEADRRYALIMADGSEATMTT